jgi:TonB family protein
VRLFTATKHTVLLFSLDCVQRLLRTLRRSIATSAVVALSPIQRIGAQAAPPGIIERPEEVVIGDWQGGGPVGSPVRIDYPAGERAKGHQASFAAVFVVDTTGRVEWNTIAFTSDAPPPFRRAVCEFLRRQRMRPIERDGVLRRGLFVQPFSFSLGTGPAPPSEDIAAPIREAMMRQGVEAAGRALARQPHCVR